MIQAKNIVKILIILFFYSSVRRCMAQNIYSELRNGKYESNRCPKLYPKNFIGYAPIGNLTAGNYTERPSLKGLRECVMGCCVSETCNVAFLNDVKCYHIECFSNELCMPLMRNDNPKMAHVSMILVKPVLQQDNWADLMDPTIMREQTNFGLEDEFIPYSTHKGDLLPEVDDDYLTRFIKKLPLNIGRTYENYLENGNRDIIDCEVGTNRDCAYDEECLPLTLTSRNGICRRKESTEESREYGRIRGYSKGPLEVLKKAEEPIALASDLQQEQVKADPTTEKTVQKLLVSVVSKNITLPEKEVTLAAYTMPDEKSSNTHYNYVWKLVDQPKSGFTGNMNQNGPTVTLTDLTEGQYSFSVSVSGEGWAGEGYANVTVLRAARANSPPQAHIAPAAQTVKLPISGAVLDGSASTDDDKIISWHWELQSGPIGYQPPLQDGPTLVLNDLKQPGNYTFKLTVEDSDHVKNWTTANITVLNATDYPPEANAGQDVIIYLPQNSLTLNGSLSTDDHEITSWEWTKAAESENKAVDMQNTNTPYLELSNLSEGVYTFVLKVTDSSGQSKTADVHVFVKPPTNTPPTANAGPDQFIPLPQTWVSLNGSGSSDDHRILSYTWRCVQGPNNVTIVGLNESVANATGLTKGEYTFELTVLDDNGNTATDNITVTVTQNKNNPPKADAGGDQVLPLPLPVLILNGSRSSDDFRIVSWKWTRSGTGLAAGKVILDSDKTPILMLTDVVPGRYVFELAVTDDQGESDRDTVSVQVKPDPLERSLLEMTLNAAASSFTQTQLDALRQKLTLLLGEDVQVNVTDVRTETGSGNAQIIFFLSEKGAAVEGLRALSQLRSGGVRAVNPGGRLRSVRCLSACSGRGVCDEATRACRCDAFWMQSLWTALDPDAQPNCDWSVVYASLGGVAVVGVVTALCVALTRVARRAGRGRPRSAPPTYRLLPHADLEDKPFAVNNGSDTETDSDNVVFESMTKSTSFTSRAANGDLHKGRKNGHFKPSRKVKT